MEKVAAALRTLHEETSDLVYNRSEITEFEGWMKPLQFYREHVSRSWPVVMRGAASAWPAVSKWNPQYFCKTLGEMNTRLTITANGLADAVTLGPDGKEYFVLPYETTAKFSHFLNLLEKRSENYVSYIQTQNSNLSDYPDLLSDVPEHIELATYAFGVKPDAVNFWMGDERAITSMHKDPYENMYCVISGHKDFLLIPPTERQRVPHRTYPVARFAPVHDDGAELAIVPVADAQPVRWIAFDPLEPDCGTARAYRVRVHAGDCLYLPSFWFHHVRQSHGCIAVNYWYDMDFDVKYCYYNAMEKLCDDES